MMGLGAHLVALWNEAPRLMDNCGNYSQDYGEDMVDVPHFFICNWKIVYFDPNKNFYNEMGPEQIVKLGLYEFGHRFRDFYLDTS